MRVEASYMTRGKVSAYYGTLSLLFYYHIPLQYYKEQL